MGDNSTNDAHHEEKLEEVFFEIINTTADIFTNILTKVSATIENVTTPSVTAPFISINPRILSGIPCLNGTRLPVYIVAETAWAGDNGVEDAMSLWNLTREDVLTACWYVGAYGMLHALPPLDYSENPNGDSDENNNFFNTKWGKRWRKWAKNNHALLWNGAYDEIPDPPRKKNKEKKQEGDT